MSKIYCHVNADGSVAITHLALNRKDSGLTDAEWEVWALAKTQFELGRPPTDFETLPDGTRRAKASAPKFKYGEAASMARCNAYNLHEMDSADLPIERSERGKWRHVDGKVVVKQDV